VSKARTGKVGQELALRSKASAIVQLTRLEEEIDARSTAFAKIKEVERLARGMHALHADSTEIRHKAEWVIAKCARRIGVEIAAVPKATIGPGRGKKNLTDRKILLGRGATGIPGHLRSRYLKLKDCAPDDVSLAGYMEPIWATNKPATIPAIINAIADEARADRRARSRSAPVLVDGMDFRKGDSREVLSDVADGSVALVLTDPPYEKKSESLYRWLGEWAARVLVPGGSLICFTGHWSLNRDMKIFDEHLRYWWVLALLHGLSKRLPGKFVMANFKPVLWYVKGHRRGKALIPDVLKDAKRDKDRHDWGQGEAGVTKLIEDLTDPGELVADPFAGTCLWGRIAVAGGRRWVGADIEEGGATEVAA
jgi:hypothetical protein